MSITRCKWCETLIDTDFDAEHVENCRKENASFESSKTIKVKIKDVDDNNIDYNYAELTKEDGEFKELEIRFNGDYIILSPLETLEFFALLETIKKEIANL